MPTYKTAGSETSFSYSIQYCGSAGNWTLEYVEIFRDGKLIITKDYFGISHFQEKVQALCYAVEECESIVYEAFPHTRRYLVPPQRAEFHA